MGSGCAEPSTRVLYLSAGKDAARGTFHRLDLKPYFDRVDPGPGGARAFSGIACDARRAPHPPGATMVLAHHLVWTAYGFWLPNDPRGSWSDFVRSWELFWHGAATKVTTPASLARRPHNREVRQAQKSALRYDPVTFTPRQIGCVARGFARAAETGYVLHACAILPNHVHAVVRRHHHLAARIIGHLKTRATETTAAAAGRL